MIELRQVTVRAGKHELRDISFKISRGEYAVMMGRTGSGKTTLLEAICGLRKVQRGEIWIDGVNMTRWLPGAREIGYVPQDGALFPNLSVHEHLAFALRLRRQPSSVVEARIAELASVLQITHLLARSVTKLSGGEAQRVALGRALAFHPKVLILDEPLSALDEETRAAIVALLRSIQRTTGVTTLHVTHNREEANSLGDRRFLLTEHGLEEQSSIGRLAASS